MSLSFQPDHGRASARSRAFAAAQVDADGGLVVATVTIMSAAIGLWVVILLLGWATWAALR